MNTTQSIDIYADNPVVTLAYKIAVMQFALDHGEHTVQAQHIHDMDGWIHAQQSNVDGGHEEALVFNWLHWMYRINPESRPFVMPGFNPKDLDQYKVGLPDGWRLLHIEEIGHMSIKYGYTDCPDIQEPFEFLRDGRWRKCSGAPGDLYGPGFNVRQDSVTYRTKLSRDEVLAL